jgi:hypothetical protein
MDTKNPISTKNPSADEYLPLFENILQDPESSLDKETIAHIRKYLDNGHDAVIALFASTWRKKHADFRQKHQTDFDKIGELFDEPWFEKIVRFLEPQLGKEGVEQTLEFWYAYELELAFDGLIEYLAWYKHPLPEEMQKQLLAFAEDFDSRSNGKTRYVEELHKAFA